MKNCLNVGTEIMRADGTRETYYGWDLAEIKALELAYHGYAGELHVLGKVYEIENEFHRYTYDEDNGIFRDYNDPAGEITEMNSDHSIAHYIWSAAIEADEDSMRAYRNMAIDIFGSFYKWREMTFRHMMLQFEVDRDYLLEVTR